LGGGGEFLPTLRGSVPLGGSTWWEDKLKCHFADLGRGEGCFHFPRSSPGHTSVYKKKLCALATQGGRRSRERGKKFNAKGSGGGKKKAQYRRGKSFPAIQLTSSGIGCASRQGRGGSRKKKVPDRRNLSLRSLSLGGTKRGTGGKVPGCDASKKTVKSYFEWEGCPGRTTIGKTKTARMRKDQVGGVGVLRPE